MNNEIQDLVQSDFERSMPRSVRERIMRGEIQGGEDIAALRRFLGMTQKAFAQSLGISIHSLRNWEQGRRKPEGPALALIRIVARHPRVLREDLAVTG